MKFLKNYLSKLFVPKRVIHNVDKEQVLLVLPFLGRLSLEITSHLQKRFKKYIICCSLKVVYQSNNRIANVFISSHISCIYTGTIFSCKTIKLSEKFGRKYKHLGSLFK